MMTAAIKNLDVEIWSRMKRRCARLLDEMEHYDNVSREESEVSIAQECTMLKTLASVMIDSLSYSLKSNERNESAGSTVRKYAGAFKTAPHATRRTGTTSRSAGSDDGDAIDLGGTDD